MADEAPAFPDDSGSLVTGARVSRRARSSSDDSAAAITSELDEHQTRVTGACHASALRGAGVRDEPHFSRLVQCRSIG